ncbi:MAG: hypothetical protein KH423_03430 [Actinomycetaceae bacterium]|nr:hypothetical protein [Actinomycetaceae bacterium]
MNILLLSLPLPGLTGQQVADIAQTAWKEVRPEDTLQIFPFTEGSPLPGVGSGLAEVYEAAVGEITPLPLPYPAFSMAQGRHAVIDCATTHSWYGQKSLTGSTADLGKTVQALPEIGVENLHLHLPRFMAPTDLGKGFLGSFGTAKENNLAGSYLALRRTLQELQTVITFDTPQVLDGISGMARSWMHYGISGEEAQDFSRQVGEWVHKIGKIADHYYPDLLSAQSAESSESNFSIHFESSPLSARSARSANSGVGGGIGFLGALCDIPCWPLGEYLYTAHIGVKLREAMATADLVAYIGGNIAADFPAGLRQVAQAAAQRAIACLVLTDFSTLRRGDIPQYGLAGCYELHPESAFLPLSQYMQFPTVQVTPVQLGQAVQRLAHTWGW